MNKRKNGREGEGEEEGKDGKRDGGRQSGGGEIRSEPIATVSVRGTRSLGQGRGSGAAGKRKM